jgi:non-heme chloroperoxidase
MDGEKDLTVPWHREGVLQAPGNKGLTEIVKITNRGRAPTIDSGWREVADKALAFIRKHDPKVEAA